jgi:DNA polymerase-3 subunit epsilon
MAPPDPTALAQALATVRASADFRVLERVAPREHYATPDETATLRAVYLDTETTGITRDDVIIELALVPFEYDGVTGRIFRVHPALSWLEDPGRPIPDEAVRITGITDAMVAGHRIPDIEVAEAMRDVAIVIAHNAAFDRPVVERRFPAFANVAWGCSQRDIAWKAAGYDGFGLDYLTMKHGQAFHDGHRAAADCIAGVHLLASPFDDGTLPMLEMLTTARTATVRIRAVNAPYDLKDTLKARGYRWNPGDDGKPKAWWIEVPETASADERAWLQSHAYTRGGAPKIETISAYERYSTRNGRTE